MELKDLLKVLDLESVTDLSSFKKEFKEKFVPYSEVPNIEEIKSNATGKMTGAFTTLAKRKLGLSNAEIEGKKWEEIFEMGVDKILEENTSLKEGQKPNDKAIEEWQKKYGNLEKKLSEIEEEKLSLTTALETTNKDWEGKYRGMKTNIALESAKSKIKDKIRPLNALEQVGFDNALKSNIVIEYDDKDEVVVKGTDGKRIQNPNKLGTYLSLDEAIELQATQLDLIKKNNGDSQRQVTPQTQQREVQTTEFVNKTNQRPIHPNALKHAEILKAQAGQ